MKEEVGGGGGGVGGKRGEGGAVCHDAGVRANLLPCLGEVVSSGFDGILLSLKPCSCFAGLHSLHMQLLAQLCVCHVFDIHLRLLCVHQLLHSILYTQNPSSM